MTAAETFVIVTCDDYLSLDRSDALLRRALVRRGSEVLAISWRDEALWDLLPKSDAVIIRSIWDYPSHIEAFFGWLDRLSRWALPVFNVPELIKWNLNKAYLLDLQRQDVPIPTTVMVETADEVAAAFDVIGDATAVIKPCVGGSGRGVARVDEAAARSYLQRETAAAGPFLIQEMLPEIHAGELSFVFIDGTHSHTVRSRPSAGEFRVNSQFGRADITKIDAPEHLVRQAYGIVDRLPQHATYARIDCVEREGRLICLEAETVDPTLFMHLHPEAAERLAEAVRRAPTRARRSASG